MRPAILVAVLLSFATQAQAEWQIKPFLGIKFSGDTNLIGDLDAAGGKRKPVLGVSATLIEEVFGVEADVAYGPGYFQNGQLTVVRSSLTMVTGNVVVALPRRMTEYTLRPYFAGGLGMIRARTTTTVPGLFESSRNLPALDLGGGVTGFLTRRVGVSWDVRHFRNFKAKDDPSLTNGGGPERLSFWRANMALAIRY